MDDPVTPMKRLSRKRRAGLESHYFSSPSPLKRQRTRELDSEDINLHCFPLPAKSRFFQNTPDPDALLSDPAFNSFCQDFIAAFLELYYAKPILIQEYLASSPWKLLIAVTLLNKTAGKQSIPVFFEIMDQWTTPEELAQAPLSILFEMLRDLGFGEKRSQRLVDISQVFLLDPPVAERPRPSRGSTTALFFTGDGAVKSKTVPYPPTPVSHIPGCGPYALDSYRIFCNGGEEWKAVRPTDKELIKYLQWRWAVEAYRKWDPLYGAWESIDLDYVRELTAVLTRNPISH
ncbi:DNA glycosylase [Fomes fomentarius]|nr:DNA glycosylase [Fomes fomentarius]